MKKENQKSLKNVLLRQAGFTTVALIVAVILLPAIPQASQRTFATPQEAAQALVEAAGNNDTAALLKLFGPDGKDIVESGDPVADKTGREEFAQRAHTKMHLEQEPGNPGRVTMVVGDNDWPFPVPLVRKNGQWYFDSKSGRVEILARRIGRNELIAIDVCRG